ncbi:MAG: hypothetical protein ACJ746_05080 [Bryobacteraceae bacterium]
MQKRRIVDFFGLLILGVTSGIAPSIFGLLANAAPPSHTSQVDPREEHDPGKRSEKFLEGAEAAFDSARSAYAKDDVHKGDAELDEMLSALNNCVSTLETVHKNRLYKKAEIRVSVLQRRLESLLDEISLPQRGWAEQTGRKLEEIHDKLLEGAMKK